VLSFLLLTPLIGAVLVGLAPVRNGNWLRHIAVTTALLALLQALRVWWYFDPGGDMQFAESRTWNPRLGSAFSIAVDGMSLAMVLLATLLFLLALLSFKVPRSSSRLYFLLMLLLETAVLGVFTARDWSLFYVFWELTLIPLFFLIDRLGGPQCQRAALNFVLYTMGGSVFMLVALLLLYDASPGHSFDMLAMAAGGRSLAVEAQVAIFLGLFVGFAVKMGVFPLHGWMPLVYSEAPGAVPLISSGILLKMGAYGILRAISTLPGAAEALKTQLAILAFASMLYGALLAWRSRNLIIMATYASMSHMAVVLLGIATLSRIGTTGAVMQMLGHGFAAGLLFLVLGLLGERIGSRDIDRFVGLQQRLPRFSILLIAALIGSVGLPGTIGFVGELHVIAAGYARWGGWVALVSLAVVIGASYALRIINQLMTNQGVTANGHGETLEIRDLGRSETLAASLLLAGMLGLGFFPAPVLSLVSGTARQVELLLARGAS
jgi:NADH-quinone oxidoreductase subunit M